MKNLATVFFAGVCILGIATTGFSENMVNVVTHPATVCSSACSQVGWLSLTFDAGTVLTGGIREYDGELLSFDVSYESPLCKDIDYQISGTSSMPLLTTGLPAGTYGPVTFSGDPLTGTGTGIFFKVFGRGYDGRVWVFVMGEEGSSITVPAGGLTIKLFDSLTYPGFLWKRGVSDAYSEPLEPEDNTLQLDTRWAETNEVHIVSFESNSGLAFSGDTLLANLLFVKADAGQHQIVFDEVDLDGSGSQGTIVRYDWQLVRLHFGSNGEVETTELYKTAEGINPTISKLEPGFYNVVLTVTDDVGCTGESTRILAVAGSCRRMGAAPYLLLLDN